MKRDKGSGFSDQGSGTEDRSRSSLDPESRTLNPSSRHSSEHRRRRFRRRGRRAYIRSVYFLPSLATLGNAICGFAAVYVAALATDRAGPDPLAAWSAAHSFAVAAYLIFLAMIFDALDGRLARFARHTTDFGGQLDSLADVVSFGAAPAFLALQVFKYDGPHVLLPISRLVWAVGALYVACALIRLARFNVSNKHGEQHHFSFLGLPSPGAAATVAALVIMQQELKSTGGELALRLSNICVWLLPVVVLLTGLLMVSAVRYPHLVNRYLRGRRSVARLLFVVIIVLLLVVKHQYTIGVGTLVYALWGPVNAAYQRLRRRGAVPAIGLPQPPRPA